VSHFHDQHTTRIQVFGSLAEDGAYQIKAIAAAIQCKGWLGAVLQGKPAHGRRVHIGRIRYDQIITETRELPEQVRLHCPYAVLQLIGRDIATSHGKCARRDIGGINFCSREAVSNQDGETS